jgi:uncharacterized protein
MKHSTTGSPSTSVADVFLLDVNVVLAAHRDDHPHHFLVRRWFDALLSSDDPSTVPTPSVRHQRLATG